MAENQPSRKTESDWIIGVGAKDPEMRAAIKQAQDTFPQFVSEIEKEYRRAIPALQLILVKAYFTDDDKPDQGEHMWVDNVQLKGDQITGRLSSSPQSVKSVKRGQKVSFPVSRLSDWLYVADGKAHGAFTVRLLRSRMSASEREEHDRHYPFTFD